MDDGMKGLAWGKMVLGGWRLLPSEFRSIFETDSLLVFVIPQWGAAPMNAPYWVDCFRFSVSDVN
jgi:hypothetical protein